MVPEAPLDNTAEGIAPGGEGWFVLNATEARWRDRGPRGVSVAFTGATDFEAETYFPDLGANLFVLEPGQPIGMYHWEDDQEDFLVLGGEALLIIEGQERPLRRWDFVHCPPQTSHIIVGAGDGPCAVLAIGTRQHMTDEEWGAYTVDEAAVRHGAGVETETSDSGVAYGSFPEAKMTPYRDGWLPG